MKAVLWSLIMIGWIEIGFARQTESKIISQPSSPIKIEYYTGKYEEGNAYTEKGITHYLQYRNNSTRKVVAVQLGLVSFDIWNEFFDRIFGVGMDAMAPGESRKGTWVSVASSGFSFNTGVAYVNKVRFENGEVWAADMSAIMQDLRKVQRDFDVTNLKKKGP